MKSFFELQNLNKSYTVEKTPRFCCKTRLVYTRIFLVIYVFFYLKPFIYLPL